MLFEELNITNVNFIRPIYDNLKRDNYCHRDEVMHPRKIVEIGKQTSWPIFMFETYPYFSCTIPWNTTYTSYGYTITGCYFRVLCTAPSMFENMDILVQNIDTINFDKLYSWLNNYSESMFLLTNVVLENEHGSRYVSGLSKVHHLEDVMHHSDEELQLIIENNCFSIANGVTLFLAMLRINKIPHELGYNVLQQFFNPNRLMNYYQPVNELWQNIYYRNTYNHIADFPSMYVCNGPDFVHISILNLFYPLNDLYHIPHIQIYNQTMRVALPHSMMFPHFNVEHWKKHQSIYKYIYGNLIIRTEIASQNINVNTSIAVNPDYPGLIQAIISSEEAFEYWRQNKNDILESILFIKETQEQPSSSDANMSYMNKRLRSFLQTCFHYYEYSNNRESNNSGHSNNSESTDDQSKKRMREIWMDLIDYVVIHDTGNFIKQLATLCIMNKCIIYNLLFQKIPTLFIQDVFNKYFDKPQFLFDDTNLSGVASSSIITRLMKMFPNVKTTQVTFSHSSYLSYKLDLSFYNICCMNDDLGDYVRGKALNVLCCHKYFASKHPHGHCIYTLMSEYLKLNKQYLLV